MCEIFVRASTHATSAAILHFFFFSPFNDLIIVLGVNWIINLYLSTDLSHLKWFKSLGLESQGIKNILISHYNLSYDDQTRKIFGRIDSLVNNWQIKIYSAAAILEA